MASGIGPLARVRAKSFLVSCLVGASAGGVSGWFGETLSLGGGLAAGLLAMVMAGQAGGFLGMFLGSALDHFRAGRSGRGVSTEAVQLVSCFGGFLGLVVALVSLQWDQALWWAAVGALVAGVAGGAAGDLADVLLRLSVLDESGDEERAAQAGRDRGGAGLRVDLLEGEMRHPVPFPEMEAEARDEEDD